MNAIQVVIPARFASTRLPAKPLLEIENKPMVIRVAEAARRAGFQSITVATEDERIKKVVTTAGIDCCLTRENHHSGTDRIAEVVEKRGWSDDSIVINLQGDEPLMPKQALQQVSENLKAHPKAEISTLCTPITSAEEMHNPNIVKVICDRKGYALYFSRAAIPWQRDQFAHNEFDAQLPSYRHIGLYAYRCGFLRRFNQWPQVGIEQSESLEQLRALWYGIPIYVDEAIELPPPGVDTEEDLKRVRAHFKMQAS